MKFQSHNPLTVWLTGTADREIVWLFASYAPQRDGCRRRLQTELNVCKSLGVGAAKPKKTLRPESCWTPIEGELRRWVIVSSGHRTPDRPARTGTIAPEQADLTVSLPGRTDASCAILTARRRANGGAAALRDQVVELLGSRERKP
jgi:hypothetical protein